MKKYDIKKTFLWIAGVTFLVASFGVSARAGENQFFGTLTGATIGGIIGNQFGHGNGRVATTAAGAIAGGWIGNDIGYSMDNSARTAPSSRAGGSSPSSSASSPSYSNYRPNYVAPDDSPSPESVYSEAYSGYCRTYSQQVNVNNHIQEHYGTACLQPDGTWHAVQ